jgi:hypothetical protein
MRKLSSFKRFCEEDMNPSMDKKVQSSEGKPEEKEKEDYFGALGDEFGMEWKDIVSAFSKEPWVSSYFDLGSPGHKIKYKLSAWEIVPGSMTPNGADIRLKPQRGNRSYLKGNRLNKSEPDTKRYHLNRKQLMQFLTQGWTPALQNNASMGGDLSPASLPGQDMGMGGGGMGQDMGMPGQPPSGPPMPGGM